MGASRELPYAAWVNIQTGCDNSCAFCIVPSVRGPEVSRTFDDIVAVVELLARSGVAEVTLLGQNVNSFGKGNPNTANREPRELHNDIGKVGPREGEENFPQLLRAIDTDPRCQALKRIRFTSSHPLDFSDELLDCYLPIEKGGVARLAGQLHLPVQSGSDAILQKMGRHHRIESYIAQMERIRKMNPDVGLSTDLIVGFPTETEEDFQATLRLLDRIQYDTIFAFAYSPRPGTRAAKFVDDVPADVKNDRLNRLLQHQLRISEARNLALKGRMLEILVEAVAKNQFMAERPDPDADKDSENFDADEADKNDDSKVWTGRTSCNRLVHFVSDSPRNLVGRFVEVRITRATPIAHYGELIEDALAAEALVPGLAVGELGRDYDSAISSEVAP